MAFIDKISKSMSKTTQSISKLSSQMMEVSKLNMSIRKREEEIEEKLLELGHYVYSRFRKMNMVSRSEVVELIHNIEAMENEIESIEKLIRSIKNINYCSSCREEFEDDVRFCPLCGKMLK
ncbi:zinc ribbon domain-containing protein [Alkaliphilus serpentinus]|uniref:Zinc ribbon domain-containing protein n=1 Tax=Alkaliphilus serpentinus TaxID=1482731 RepID=A0A833HN89_9FIRM|nr:zinc ribbon domain-containing protein [Alkaliphilus serpentinus]KAB3529279.1 zinc ribbon domain-containing protein [Alkaliphilus serpentinus]